MTRAEENGSISIAEDVVAAIAADAVAEIEGVGSMCQNMTEQITEQFTGKKGLRGVRAEVRDGDIIEINIPERSINVRLSDEELAERRKAEEARGKKAFTPPTRQREVWKALRAYGKMVSSADKGGVRIVED